MSVQHSSAWRGLCVGLVVILLLSLTLTTPQPAQAASIIVTSLEDDGSAGTLHAAILQANASTGADTITFAVSGTINLRQDLPPLTGTLTINGAGRVGIIGTSTEESRDRRVFEVANGATVVLNGLTITKGRITTDIFRGGAGIGNRGTLTINNSLITRNFGSAILNTGSLYLNHSVVSHNEGEEATEAGGIFNEAGTMIINDTIIENNTVDHRADTSDINITGGAGIFNRGTMILNRSIVRNNRVLGDSSPMGGGGIFNRDGSVLVLNDTLVEGNVVINSGSSRGDAFGGGLYGKDTSAITLTNSTISGNSVEAQNGNVFGGGVWMTESAQLTTYHSTIASNGLRRLQPTGSSSGSGLGISGFSQATLNNSIVGNNQGAGDCHGSTVTAAFSLVEGGGCGVINGLSGNKTGDPGLGVLADNGGLAFTHLPLSGSIVIDAGSAALIPLGVTTDQRGAGFVRVVGPNPDMGAVESTPADGIGVKRPNNGIIDLRNNLSSGTADYILIYGFPTDVPLVGDWNGDQLDTVGFYRPSTAFFTLSDQPVAAVNGLPTTAYNFGYGSRGDLPVAGDWNGDGRDSVGVYRASLRMFYLRNTLNGGFANVSIMVPFAQAGDIPIVGDWNGDNLDTPGLYRPSTAQFLLTNRATAGTATIDFLFTFGEVNFKPIVGDWNGDNRDGIGVYDPDGLVGGVFSLRNGLSAGVPDLIFTFGGLDSTPLAGGWSLPAPLTAPVEVAPPFTPQ